MKTRIRYLLIALVLALCESFAGTLHAGTIPRVGFLDLSDPSSRLFESFRQGLRELGYIEGQNIIVEPRFTFGNNRRLNELAGELVRLQVNVIVAQSTLGLKTAMSWTKTIPIVMTFIGDPVAAGFVASLERPGGNVTGIGGLAAGLGGKWLELIKETVPGVSRVGVLVNPQSERMTPELKAVETAARSLRVELQPARAEF